MAKQDRKDGQQRVLGQFQEENKDGGHLTYWRCRYILISFFFFDWVSISAEKTAPRFWDVSCIFCCHISFLDRHATSVCLKLHAAPTRAQRPSTNVSVFFRYKEALQHSNKPAHIAKKTNMLVKLAYYNDPWTHLVLILESEWCINVDKWYTEHSQEVIGRYPSTSGVIKHSTSQWD